MVRVRKVRLMCSHELEGIHLESGPEGKAGMPPCSPLAHLFWVCGFAPRLTFNPPSLPFENLSFRVILQKNTQYDLAATAFPCSGTNTFHWFVAQWMKRNEFFGENLVTEPEPSPSRLERFFLFPRERVQVNSESNVAQHGASTRIQRVEVDLQVHPKQPLPFVAEQTGWGPQRWRSWAT